MKDPFREKKKKLVRHAYLEEIGLPRRQCGTNFTRSTKVMKKERKKYGFDRRDTYVLGDTFAQWLYEHLRMYLDVADPVIDLDCELTPIICAGRRCTIREAVQSVLRPLRKYLELSKDCDADTEEECRDLLRRASFRWAEIAPYLSW